MSLIRPIASSFNMQTSATPPAGGSVARCDVLINKSAPSEASAKQQLTQLQDNASNENQTFMITSLAGAGATVVAGTALVLAGVPLIIPALVFLAFFIAAFAVHFDSSSKNDKAIADEQAIIDDMSKQPGTPACPDVGPAPAAAPLALPATRF